MHQPFAESGRLSRARSCGNDRGELDFEAHLVPNTSAAEEVMPVPLEDPCSPWPSIPGLPADDQPDLDRPFEFFSRAQLSFPSNLNFPDSQTWQGDSSLANQALGTVYVILFGVGEHETEGIYSLRADYQKDDEGLPVDTVIAFTEEDDATRYSTLLEATMDYVPTVFPIQYGELTEFCNDAGYRCRIEPRGSLLIPPDHNVGLTDWEKSLQLRQGHYSVLESEPVRFAEQVSISIPEDSLFIDGPEWIFESSGVGAAVAQGRDNLNSQLSDPILFEALKQSLERLLPQND